ncbi:MAG: SAM-dependent methyltransferase [Thermodesulfobacteriota bacterium]
MDLALYQPGGGYYTSSTDRWGGGRGGGGGGDYITNLDISPVFAVTIAKEVYGMWTSLDSPPLFRLIEPGAGRGWLSKGIVATARERYPDFYEALGAHLIEKNPALRETATGKVSWHENIEDIEGLGTGFIGCILSNEFFDSLPFHRVVRREDGLKEIYVGLDKGRLVDVEEEPSTGDIPRYFEDAGIALAPGHKAEAGLLAVEWMGRAAALMERGYVLTIDYGYPAEELYAPGPGRKDGTLLCHFRNTLNDDPYRNVGSQDITAHVDFTGLVRAGRDAGMEPMGFATQSEFLLGLGIMEELQEVGEGGGGAPGDYDKIKHNQGIKELIMPGGVGDTFKVLTQGKGVGNSGLKGFSFKNRLSSISGGRA